MKKKHLLILFMIASVLVSCADKVKSYNEGVNILPKPKSYAMREGKFTINKNTVVLFPNGVAFDIVLQKLRTATGYELPRVDEYQDNSIYLVYDHSMDIADEYEMNINSKAVFIGSSTSSGLFYGLQSLLQLLPAEIESPTVVKGMDWSIDGIAVRDVPQFQYRGMHLDVCRHFRDVEFIKKQLDVLAMFKINRLHWHLTDDQLWTIEIKKYPKLTEIGSVRTEGDGSIHKGYYTQDQIREVVQYAKDRFIEVIPEIEFPGHAMAALKAYPEYSCSGGPFEIRNVWGIEEDVFCAGNEQTYKFAEDVLTEVASLFPFSYIHIGGDECPKSRWKACAKCQAKMRKEGLKSEDELQSYFMKRIGNHLRTLNKLPIGWDEVLDGGASDDMIVMSWRGENGAIEATNRGLRTILTPNTWMYLDYYQGAKEVEPVTIGGFVDLKKVYSYNPLPEGVDKNNRYLIEGVQGNVWAEYLYDEAQSEYMIYPRILAVAEVAWSDAYQGKDYADFCRRLNNAQVRLDYNDINYHIPLPEGMLESVVAFENNDTLTFTNSREYTMVYTLDGSEPTATSQQYTAPIVVSQSGELKIATMLPQGKLSSIRTVKLSKESATAAIEQKVEQGILASKIEGYHKNSASYSGVDFGQKRVVSYFTPVKEFDYKKPSVEMYEGYILVEQDGVYTFAANGEQLWLDGILLIDNDNKVKKSLVNRVQKSLKKGLHPFKYYFNNSITGGYPATWQDNTIYIGMPNGDKLEKIAQAQLFY